MVLISQLALCVQPRKLTRQSQPPLLYHTHLRHFLRYHRRKEHQQQRIQEHQSRRPIHPCLLNRLCLSRQERFCQRPTHQRLPTSHEQGVLDVRTQCHCRFLLLTRLRCPTRTLSIQNPLQTTRTCCSRQTSLMIPANQRIARNRTINTHLAFLS